MNIVVVGTGYVGLSNAVLLAQHNHVTAVDIVTEKVDLINKGISPIRDPELEKFLARGCLDLVAVTDGEESYKSADYIIIATPTNYNIDKNYFDTSSIEKVIEEIINVNINVSIVVRSTIPIGYIDAVRKKYNIRNIMFCPEFLREGSALYDNLNPSRIIIGDNSDIAIRFSKLLSDAAIKQNIPVLYIGTREAEAVKLFTNTYLAMRVAYFNELDIYAELKGLNSREIIDGICADSRIGNYYNNPSFGYGGYCLPKDTRQLLAEYNNIPNNIISAVVASNVTRKKYITEQIINKKPRIVGIYKLTMKNSSDNFRQSAIIDVMELLNNHGIRIEIYEPMISKNFYLKYEVIKDLREFKERCDVIVANRMCEELNDVLKKVYTRDLFYRD
ncbi:MAG: nucleotide sugar dehydrogenase [Lachnospiraceae bacterium]|jgi:nucleotide sugar dehydrogenase